MAEVVVERYEDETEAETVAGYLRSIGLRARVSFRATLGAPRQVVPVRVVAPMGEYELRVPEAEADEARREIQTHGRPGARPRRYRWLGIALVVVWVLPLILGTIVAITSVLGR